MRTVECVQGEVPVELICAPRFDYGRVPARWSPVDGEGDFALDATDGKTTVRLFSDMRMGIEQSNAHARHTMREGEQRFCALSWTEQLGGPRTYDQAFAHVQRTCHYWREWLAAGTYPDHPWRAFLQRSALVLKGLTYSPTGAMIAALTTSLPETPGGERNWDYRYCWMRDATFTLWGLHALDLDWEANDFMEYLADLAAQQGRLAADHVRDRRRAEPARDARFATSRATRDHGRCAVGNGAYNQRQNDCLRRGARLRLPAHQAPRPHPGPPLAGALRPGRKRLAGLEAPRPGDLGGAREAAPLRLLEADVLGRAWIAARAWRSCAARPTSPSAGRPAPRRSARTSSTRGVDERGVFVQHYDTTALDASCLLIPIVRFLPADDERVRGTVLAIADELTDHGLVLRYRTDETDDGLSGEEGTFLICSFWMVSALSEIGERERARTLCERLLSLASPLALYAEELDARSGRHLGNFPQAFTHLALINAVAHVISRRRLSKRSRPSAVPRPQRRLGGNLQRVALPPGRVIVWLADGRNAADRHDGGAARAQTRGVGTAPRRRDGSVGSPAFDRDAV